MRPASAHRMVGEGTDEPPARSVCGTRSMRRASAHRMVGCGAVSRLTALVPAVVCARALGRAWPEDLDGQVRCIDEGTRALGLAHCCAPWSVEAEGAALRAGLGDHADPALGLPEARMEGVAAGTHPNLESLPSHRGNARAGLDGDVVATALARVPGAPPVAGLVSGPLTWSIRVGSGAALEEAIDTASDLAAARVRALAGCGVERVVVVESLDDGRVPDATLADEAHRPVLRTAEHLRVDLVLIAIGLDDVESLDYNRWASDRGCSSGLGFLPKEAFDSRPELERYLDRLRIGPDTAEVTTAPLDAGVSPDLVRHAARALAQVVVGP